MGMMFRTLLINIYLKIYQYYIFLRKIFFSCINNVKLVYFIDGDKVKNISINYYLGLKSDNFKTGKYYLKIFNGSGTNHIAFNGNINDVSRIKIAECYDNPPKRKNVILLDNGVPLDINLEILDNYVSNIKYFPEQSIINLGSVLQFLGFSCTHATIIETKPFSKTITDVNDVDVGHLYH